MSKNRKTLVSMRMDNDILTQIDDYLKLHTYYSRTTVICHLLRALFQCGRHDVVNEILRHFDPYDEGIVIKISKIKES